MEPNPQTLADAIASYLTDTDVLLVPVAHLVTIIGSDAVSEETILAAVSADDRFYVHLGAELEPHSVDELALQEAAITEELGYDFGPKVMLRQKAPNAEAVFKAAAQELKTVKDALSHAYRHSGNNPELTKKLTQALQKAKQIEDELARIFTELPKKN